MSHTVFALSAKGRSELINRRSNLPPELRQTLQLVDGQRTRADLLAQLSKSATVAGGLRWLTQAGYLQPCGAGEATPPPSMASAEPLPAPDGNAVPRDGASFSLLSSFLTDAVRQHLGLRGFAQQLKIERAASLADLIERIAPLADAITRAANAGTARAFVATAQSLAAREEAPAGLTN